MSLPTIAFQDKFRETHRVCAVDKGPKGAIFAMCYIIFLSTTSAEALDDLPSDLYRFARATEEDDKAIAGLLKHSHRWRLEGQYGSCSCHFRHLGEGNDMGFAPPEEWCPEDSDDIESTRAVYDVLAHVVMSGHGLDLIDLWNDARPDAIKDLSISLRDVPRDRFRFFENHRFILSL